jgi:hypothetical protein
LIGYNDGKWICLDIKIRDGPKKGAVKSEREKEWGGGGVGGVVVVVKPSSEAFLRNSSA